MNVVKAKKKKIKRTNRNGDEAVTERERITIRHKRMRSEEQTRPKGRKEFVTGKKCHHEIQRSQFAS